MIIEGKVFRFGDNVNTDEIIPARYLSTHDPNKLARYCMEDIRPGFSKNEKTEGGIIVAGENFGCGSSREHAPISIKYSGIQCVIARSFARIFLRNSINIGLPVIELKKSNEFEEGNIIVIDLQKGQVDIKDKNRGFCITPYPPFLRDIVSSGGWLKYAVRLTDAEEKK